MVRDDPVRPGGGDIGPEAMDQEDGEVPAGVQVEAVTTIRRRRIPAISPMDREMRDSGSRDFGRVWRAVRRLPIWLRGATIAGTRGGMVVVVGVGENRRLPVLLLLLRRSLRDRAGRMRVPDLVRLQGGKGVEGNGHGDNKMLARIAHHQTSLDDTKAQHKSYARGTASSRGNKEWYIPTPKSIHLSAEDHRIHHAIYLSACLLHPRTKCSLLPGESCFKPVRTTCTIIQPQKM